MVIIMDFKALKLFICAALDGIRNFAVNRINPDSRKNPGSRIFS